MDRIKEESFEPCESFEDPLAYHSDIKDEADPTFSISMEDSSDFLSEKNPWASKELKDFVFYHCPECEFQSPVENQFYEHAVNTHEKAKEIFEEPEYCKPFQEDYDLSSMPVNDIDWYVYPNQPPNSVHTLTNEVNKGSTVLQENSAINTIMAEDYAELHLEPLYHNSISRAEKFIEELQTNKRLTFRCPLYSCDEKFNSRELFFLHQASVHDWILFGGKPMKSKTKKKEVLKISKENGRFPCPFKCGSYFENEQTLKAHLIYDLEFKCIKACKSTKNNEKTKPKRCRFTCLICDKNCSSAGVLKIHMKKNHGGINCHHCGSSYKTLGELYKHIRKHHKDSDSAPSINFQRVVCEHCGKSVSSRHIKTHVDYYHTEGEFMCEECGESFKFKYLLASHRSLKNSHKSKQHAAHWKCDRCDKVFRHGGNLTEHKKTVHQDNSKRFCEFCQKMFVNGAELFKHFTDSHPGMECPAKPGVEFYQCHQCHKILASQTALYTHYKLTHKIRYKGLDLVRMCDKVPTKCPECQQIWNSFMECVDHYLDNHGLDLHKELKNPGGSRRGKGRYLYCNNCDFKTFKTMSYFNHRKLH